MIVMIVMIVMVATMFFMMLMGTMMLMMRAMFDIRALIYPIVLIVSIALTSISFAWPCIGEKHNKKKTPAAEKN